MEKINAKEFVKRFNQNHPYIEYELTEKQVQKWLDQKIIKGNIDLIESMFMDYLIGQGIGTLHGA